MKTKIVYFQIVDGANLPENINSLPVIAIVNDGTGGYIIEGLEALARTILLTALSKQEAYSEYIPFALFESETIATTITTGGAR